MADTNKVVPLPPGQKRYHQGCDMNWWWTIDSNGEGWEWDNDEGIHSSEVPEEIEEAQEAYLDQQAQAQQDTAHTDWKARAEAAEARCQQLEGKVSLAKNYLNELLGPLTNADGMTIASTREALAAAEALLRKGE